MQTILLSSRLVLVDDEDLLKIQQYSWYIGGNGYATHKARDLHLLMHRFVLDYYGPKVVDHIDRNKLNNQKSNLRVVDQWVNNYNTGLPRHNTSGVKGVSYNTNTNKYDAYITIANRKKHIGSFNTLFDAAIAREGYESSLLALPTLRETVFTERANNVSGVVGVSFNARMNRWKAKIGPKHLGYFKTKEEAVEARRIAEAVADANNRTHLGNQPSWGELGAKYGGGEI